MKVLSLFSGCGGLDAGFAQSHFDIVMANDFDRYACQTCAANFKAPIVCEDVNKIEIDSLPLFDVLIGGFPCQPFSVMGGVKDSRTHAVLSSSKWWR